jgi:UDP-glucose 4-epimerase
MSLKDKNILITGGTGSLGKVLVGRILKGDFGLPEKVIVLSRDEAKQHEMRIQFMNKSVTTDEVIYENFQRALEFRIGDVRSYADVCSSLRDVDIVINAAALKQVPSCEYFPDQAIETNCYGPINIVRAIRENNLPISIVVGISTDKACKPVNVMGMTKSLQEKILTSANILNNSTRFIAVRYGNVFASRGSVIPLFHDQILSGGPVTITVPEMTRFLLSLDQAVDTVMAAIDHAKAGEIFVPRAPSATVLDIAKVLIGDREIELIVTGIRPAEKMHEIMVSDEEAPYVQERGDYYAIGSMLPELNDNSTYESSLKSEYSSKNSTIGFDEIKALFEKHNLMIDQVHVKTNSEFLR